MNTTFAMLSRMKLHQVVAATRRRSKFLFQFGLTSSYQTITEVLFGAPEGANTIDGTLFDPRNTACTAAKAAVAANISVLFALVSLVMHKENSTVNADMSPSLALIELISSSTTTGATISKAASAVASIEATLRITESL